MEFQKLKNEILEQAKNKGACKIAYNKALHTKNKQELLQVIRNNIVWLKKEGILTSDLLIKKIMNMTNLSLKTQGIRGTNPQWKEKMAFIGAFFNNTQITIDNFEGYGETYQQREEPDINIMENGKVIFSGTFEELKRKISK